MGRVLKKVRAKKSKSNIDHPYVAKTNLVPYVTGHDNRLFHSVTTPGEFIDQSNRGNSSPDSSKRINHGGLESIGRRAIEQGVSEQAAHLLKNK